MVISSGNAVHPAGRRKKKALSAHVSGWNWLCRVCLTAHQEKEKLAVRAVLGCIVGTLERLRAPAQFLGRLRKAALLPTTVLPTSSLEQKRLECNHKEELTVWTALGRIVPCSCRHAHL